MAQKSALLQKNLMNGISETRYTHDNYFHLGVQI